MDYMKAYALMSKYGIRTVESKYVSSAEEAVRFSGGKPIVLKGLSQKALHKTKSGLVALNLSSPEEIRAAFKSVSAKSEQYKPYRILAQHMLPYDSSNIEIIIGGKTDSQFGKLLLVGLGGIYVEVFRDFSARICPVGPYDADSMLSELRSYGIIAKDERQHLMLRELLLKVSRMLVENKEIDELDLNPIILHGGSYDAVDLRVLE